MTDLYLILKNLTRNKMRFILNSLALLIAFFLFGALGALNSAFNAGVELSADDRLVVINKINFTQPLPVAHINKIRTVEHVKEVTHANWFGAYFQDPKKPLVGFAVDPESYLRVYPELVLSEEEKNNWFQSRQGMIVGDRMASTYGWKVGDRVPISSNIFSHKDGGHTWDLVISGIFTASNVKTDTNFLMLHYRYFIETQSFGGEWVGWGIVATEDPKYNADVATAIDEKFANSPAETETSTEQQFNKAFLEQVGSIGLIITSVVLAAFFTILMIVGNTMILTVRERTNEIGVLKSLGFPSLRIFKMILGESILLSTIGGLFGVGFAYISIKGLQNVSMLKSMLPNLVLTPDIVIQAVLIMIALGLVTGFIPAYRAMKLNTVDALSRS